MGSAIPLNLIELITCCISGVVKSTSDLILSKASFSFSTLSALRSPAVLYGAGISAGL